MAESYDLTKLDPASFEHMVNLLAMRVLGQGHTGFGPGPDAGRDGYFEGEADYPSTADRWSGRWYIQSKFFKPHLAKDPQKWLLSRIEEELKEFKKPGSGRKWPDNWIVATNIEPSGVPETGAFDKARTLVNKANPKLKNRFHIWGGRKILDLLISHPKVSEYYQHFLTPGHVLTELFNQLKDSQAELQTILYHLIVTQFNEQQYSKLEQAGSKSDARPGIHELFIDLPIQAEEYQVEGLAAANLLLASAKSHRYDPDQPETKEWIHWSRHPSRARVWFVKGGPGHGKSTIGQYVCQVQRAALILERDGLIVNRQLKNLAREVKRAAEAITLWPTVPRIPISIELKEYAQWFGKRGKNVARGVLTYLAERISAQVEQPVLVGTLKRALQAKSWFVIFDGLDEVPHDVKDSVAAEIRHFADNIVLENNADVLILCTSRPQGYSGQFSNIDGPTIDLTSLSPEMALQCAKPVLALNRSEEEARRYFQILKSAVETSSETSSVRELMTSPLQSHIMAIVVRGGGKPPERRWQLFTTFYEVIKDREANKDFPDPRIAKLLREDEQLLRTVHNRLGFVLHARAETSEGAQTHLHRIEFKKLVASAVKQMVEKGVEETVDVLMEATTERLVLVSTPDDGDHVRFDIRPLQEFFGADFLYDSISAEKLRARIEVIAGDSHWEEVLHFLMSALVENKRQTELTVAIEVLEHINERGEHHQDRLLSRRLGRGALVAARLLREGVLEQDKRVRHQFRKCLEPLSAHTGFGQLQTLVETSQPNSKEWLINFLIDRLVEADPSECVGAAIVLSFILPSDHTRVEEVKSVFLSAPSDYISYVLSSRANSRYSMDTRLTSPPEEWLTAVLLNLLLRPTWNTLSESGTSSALELLRKTREAALRLAKSMIAEEQCAVLEALLQDENPSKPAKNSKHYCIFTAHYNDHDWTTGSSPFDSWSSEGLDKISDSPGILNLVSDVIRFAVRRDFSTFQQLINNSDIGFRSRLPSHLEAYIPAPEMREDECASELKLIQEHELSALVSERRFRTYSLSRRFKTLTFGDHNTNLDQWESLLNDHLNAGLYFWAHWADFGISNKMPQIFSDQTANDMLIEKILQDPTVIKSLPHVWGKLLSVCPSREDELRKAFLSCSTGKVESMVFLSATICHTFRMNLPSEAPLLPHVMVSILMLLSYSHHKRDNKEPINQARSLISEFINDPSELSRIIDNGALPPQVRAAAVIMQFFPAVEGETLRRFHELFIEAYEPGRSTSYLQALVTYLSLFVTEKDLYARRLVGRLLDKARGQYRERQELERLLNYWRERSHAPVQVALLEEEWLAGE